MTQIPLRLKLIFSHTFLVLILVPLLVVYLFSTLRDLSRVRLDNDLTRTGILLAETIRADPSVAINQSRRQELMERLHAQIDARIELLDQAGNIVASTDTPTASDWSEADSLRSTDRNPTAQANRTSNADDSVTVTTPVDSSGPIALVRLSLQASSTMSTFDRLRQIVLVGIVALVGLSLIVGYASSLMVSHSLRQFTDEIKAVQVGDLSRRVNIRSHDEVGELAASLNGMVDQLAEHQVARERLLDDLAHELRRPLAALQAAVEVLRDRPPNNSETVEHLMHGIQCEVGRLGRLTKRLNYAARDGDVLQPLLLAPVDLSSVVARVVLLYHGEAIRRGIDLKFELPRALPTIQANDDALVEVIANLVDNAIKFTPDGGCVRVSAGANDQGVWVQVADTGVGLTEEEQTRVFNRRYSGNRTGRYAQGLGLGLAIANELVQAHHGVIHLASHPTQGACFTVELPR